MGRTNAPGYSSLTLFFAAHSAAGEISTGKYFRRICRRANAPNNVVVLSAVPAPNSTIDTGDPAARAISRA